jgi:hypothetical protein
MKVNTLLLGTFISLSTARLVLDQNNELSENTIELTARPVGRIPFQSASLGHLPLESAYNGTDLQVRTVSTVERLGSNRKSVDRNDPGWYTATKLVSVPDHKNGDRYPSVHMFRCGLTT